jgi:hypothetical protein
MSSASATAGTTGATGAPVGASAAATSVATVTTKLAGVAIVKWAIAIGIATATIAGGYAWKHRRESASSTAVPAPQERSVEPGPAFVAPHERESERPNAGPSEPAGILGVEDNAPPRIENGTPRVERAAPASRPQKRDKREGAPAAATPKEHGADTPSLVSQEIALVDSVRNALGAGNWAAARDGLASYRSQFPHGVLEQEASVLEIEIAAGVGDRTKARALARSFVGQHPESSLRERAMRAGRISSEGE